MSALNISFGGAIADDLKQKWSDRKYLSDYNQEYRSVDFKKDENTLFGLNVGVDVADNMALIFKARETYIKNDNGEYEAVRSTQIETSVYF